MEVNNTSNLSLLCCNVARIHTRKLWEMGEEPKLTCAADSQMKTICFGVGLGALHLKEPALLGFGHPCVRDSCPPSVIEVASSSCTGCPCCCTEVGLNPWGKDRRI